MFKMRVCGLVQAAAVDKSLFTAQVFHFCLFAGHLFHSVVLGLLLDPVPCLPAADQVLCRPQLRKRASAHSMVS